MKPIQTIIADFQHYVRRPWYGVPKADQPGSHTINTVRQFLAEYPLFFGLFLVSLGTTFLANNITEQAVYKPIIQRLISSAGISMIALLLVVIMEEAVFRAILRLTPNRLRNIAALLLLIPLGYAYQPIKELTHEFALFWLILVWVVSVYLIGRYLKRPAVFCRIEAFWQANFNWIFYGVALLYAAGKVANEIGTLMDRQVLFFVALLLFGLLRGFYFGYVRMKYGFWYGVAVHVLLLVTSLAPDVIRNL